MSGKNRKPRKALEMPDYFGQNFPTKQPVLDGLTAGVGLGQLGRGRNPIIGNGGSIGSSIGAGKGIQPNVPSFNGWTIPNAAGNGVDDKWEQILGRSSQGDFANWLASLGFSGKDPNDAWTQDFNAYLMQQMVEYYKQLEARQANKEILNEQRVYESPTNQLARLMGAGISRDAAIQMLSGAGAGSGAGIAYQAQVGGEGSLTAPSQSKLNQLQGVTSVFGAIAQTAGAIGALGSFGMSAASFATNLAATKAATAGQVLSNTQLSKTLQGIETASTVIGAISSAVDAGVISKDHQFTSAQDMVQYIRDNADKFEPFNALKSSGALDGIMRDVYSLDALNHGYESWRKTRDYNIDRKHLVRMQSLEKLQAQMNIQATCSEIDLNRQKIDESIQNVLNSVQHQYNENQLTSAQVELMGEQAFNVAIRNQTAQLDAEWYAANIEDINTCRMGQLALDSAEWTEVLDNPEELKKRVETWLIDKGNQRTAVALEALYLDQEYTEQARMNTPGTSSYNARQTALYFHNLFNFALGYDKSNVDTDALEKLGKLGKTGLGLFLLKRPM